MKTESKKIGQKIRKVRQSMGLTQSQLGKAIGVTGSAVGYLEAGLRKISPDVLKKISDELNKPFRYFYEDSEGDYSLQSKVISLEKQLKELLRSVVAIEKGKIQNERFYKDLIVESPRAIIFLDDDGKVINTNGKAKVFLKNNRSLDLGPTLEKHQKAIRENRPFTFSFPKTKTTFFAKSVYEENGKYLGLWIMES